MRRSSSSIPDPGTDAFPAEEDADYPLAADDEPVAEGNPVRSAGMSFGVLVDGRSRQEPNPTSKRNPLSFKMFIESQVPGGRSFFVTRNIVNMGRVRGSIGPNASRKTRLAK